jgi:hypothetical protein
LPELVLPFDRALLAKAVEEAERIDRGARHVE